MKNLSEQPQKIKKFEFKFKINLKNLLLWGLIIWLGISFLVSLRTQFPGKEKISLSQALTDIKEGKIQRVEVEDSRLYLTYKDGQVLLSQKEGGISFTEILKSADISPESVNFVVKDLPISASLLDFLSAVIPAALMIFFFVYLYRQAKGAQDTIFSFGRSTARLFAKGKQAVTFKDVAGVEEAKKELEEVVDFLKHPGKYRKLGARTPKGVILIGPSGTGKTLLAKAVAGEANVPFFSAAGSEFMEMLVGVGPARIRDLFAQAKRAAPCLPGDTRITLSNGREVTIEQMFKNKMIGEEVISMTEDQEIESAKVVAITRRKFPRLCQIKTFHWEIEATPNHLFPILKDAWIVWKRADELTKKDYLVFPQKIPTGGEKIFLLDLLPPETRIYLKGENVGQKRILKSRKLSDWREKQISRIDFLALGQGGWTDSKLPKIPAYLNWELTYLMGLLLADGNFSKTNRFNISFINTQETLHQKVKEIIEKNFGYLPKTFLDSQSKKGIFPKRKKCWVTHINNKLIRILFERLKEKLLVLPEDLLAAFISGYFDGDGYIAKEGDLPKIVFSAWERETNLCLRSLLHRLGIVAYRSSSGNIEITGKEAVGQLREKLISFHPQKAEKIRTLNLRGRTSSRLDGIPVGPFLKKVRESLAISQRDLMMGGKISDYEHSLHVPSKESLKKVVWKMEELMRQRGQKASKEFIWLKKIIFGGLSFSRVREINFLDRPGFVYDLCLNDHHNFVANGLFVHNCIVFIDEIDAIGRQRGLGITAGHDEREQTLNQILVEMDGFTPNDNVVVLAATNRGDLLDPALMRPGRFDRRVVLDMPDLEDRKAILAIHARGKPFAKDVDWDQVARSTVGFSGADLENMLNEAAILAARENRKAITMEDINEAALKVKLGPEKKRLQTDEERKMTAYHEAGHAVVSYHLPHMDPVQRVSIISRGLAMGFTLIPPKKERYTETQSHLQETIISLLGGRAAEELVFNEFTAGAASDIDKATQIARKMVVDFGMSRLGPIYLGPQIEESEWGKSWWQPTEISPKMAAKVDEEIKRIVDEGYKRALGILKADRRKLDLLAKKLLEKETIEQEEFQKLMKRDKSP